MTDQPTRRTNRPHVCCLIVDWVGQDMVQWQGREDGILGLPFVEGMKCIPLPEPIKLQLYENIFLNCTPLFCDRTVVMLLMLLVVFSPGQVSEKM